KSPRGFRPDTKMPHFYGLSNNDADALKGTGQEKFPDAEIQAIGEFLFKQSDAYRTRLEEVRNPNVAAKRAQEDEQRIKALNKLLGAEAEEVEVSPTLSEMSPVQKETRHYHLLQMLFDRKALTDRLSADERKKLQEEFTELTDRVRLRRAA